MKRYHVLGVVFFAGVIMAAAILPAKAMPSVQMVSLNPGETVINGVDDETCTIETENGLSLDVDCDELPNFDEGDTVQVFDSEGVRIIYDETNGNRTIVN